MSKQDKSIDTTSLLKVFSGLVMIASVAKLAYDNRHRIKAFFIKLQELIQTLLPERSDVEEIVTDAKQKVTELKQQVDDYTKEVKKQGDKTAKQLKKQVTQVQAKVEQEIRQTKQSLDDTFHLNERQEAIYQFIKEAGDVTMPDIAKVIAGVTNRTLRRDTTKLEKLGLIEKAGKTKDSVYKIRK